MGEYYRFSKGIFSWVGFNTKYIPYVAEERKSGKSSFNFSKLLKYGLDGIIAFSTMPLKISSYIGGLTVFLSLVYAIITVIRKLVSNISVDGFSFLFWAVFSFSQSELWANILPKIILKQRNDRFILHVKS